jgi:hypothetical protein
MSGSIATYPSRKPETIGALELVDRDPGAAHHLRQRQHDHVGVGRGKGHRNGGQGEQHPRGAGDRRPGHGAVISFWVP